MSDVSDLSVTDYKELRRLVATVIARGGAGSRPAYLTMLDDEEYILAERLLDSGIVDTKILIERYKK